MAAKATTGVLFDVSESATVSEVPGDIRGHYVVGFSTPGTFTSATFTFQASEKKGTGADWKSIYDEVGTEISIPTVTSDDYHVVPAIWFAGVNFLQITSSASQGADATVTLHLVPVS
jgi:hypothetical protein|tara:strand:- start:132 stop:482 length:351 start_codon:yes stop_codon:yes gene_type:complete